MKKQKTMIVNWVHAGIFGIILLFGGLIGVLLYYFPLTWLYGLYLKNTSKNDAKFYKILYIVATILVLIGYLISFLLSSVLAEEYPRQMSTMIAIIFTIAFYFCIFLAIIRKSVARQRKNIKAHREHRHRVDTNDGREDEYF